MKSAIRVDEKHRTKVKMIFNKKFPMSNRGSMGIVSFLNYTLTTLL